MATLPNYSYFINEKTNEVEKVSTHKWAGMYLKGFRFCTPKEVSIIQEKGLVIESEEVQETPTPKKAKKKAAKKKAG